MATVCTHRPKHPLIVGIALCLVIWSSGGSALAQSSHPYCQQYYQYCLQSGEPYCQQYQQYCSSGGGRGTRGRFEFETVVLRSSIGAGGYFGTRTGWGMSPTVTLGPVISRGRDSSSEWRSRGLQLIPEIGLFGLIPFAAFSDDGARFQTSMNGLIGLRALRGFGGVSIGASGHMIIGGTHLVFADEELETWRFSMGLRGGVEVAFGNGICGFELSYGWTTEFMEEAIHSVLLNVYFDWVKVFTGLQYVIERL